MLHVDGGGESFERVVVEAVQGRHKVQVLRDALGEGLSERMIVDGESYVVAEQVESLELAGVVEAISVTAAQGDEAYQFAADPERDDALEEFGSDISVGA